MTLPEACSALGLQPPDEFAAQHAHEEGSGRSTQVMLEALLALANDDCNVAHLTSRHSHTTQGLVFRARYWALQLGIDPRRIREMCTSNVHGLRLSEPDREHRVFYDHTYDGPREDYNADS